MTAGVTRPMMRERAAVELLWQGCQGDDPPVDEEVWAADTAGVAWAVALIASVARGD